MLYFDNAATGGKKPLSSTLAAYSAFKEVCVNPGRSGHKLALAAANNVLACRKLLCGFFSGYSHERVVFTKNCTEALNIAILGAIFQGAHVVTTVFEHNSVLRPLNYLQKLNKIKLDIVYPKENEVFETTLGKKSKDADFVIFTLASNVTGTAIDAQKVRKIAGDKPLFICDGAQACGHIQINMKESKIDALAVAGHKGMHAIQGSGVLLFSPRIKILPILYGGTGSESNNLDMPTVFPDCLEAGTLNYPAICSLFEGTLYTQSKLFSNSLFIEDLTEFAIENLKKISGVKVYSQKNSSGIVSFSLENLPCEQVADILSEKYSIAVRAGLHCAPLIHEFLKSSGLVRASFSEFNTKKEIAIFLDAIKEISAIK